MTYSPRQGGPSKAGYWIGAVLMALGVIGGIALIGFGAKSLSDTVNSFRRVDAASGGAVSFSATGRYYAYYERVGIKDRSDLPPVRITLSRGGQSETLTSNSGRSGADEHYHIGDHEGVRIGAFTVRQSGQYRVTVNGEPGGSATDQIAFGKGSIVRGLVGVIGGLLGGGLLGLIGLVVLITTAVRRSSHRKRLAAVGYGPGPPGGYGAPPAWPPASPGAPAPWPPPGQVGQPGPPAQWASPPVWPPAAPPPGSGPTDDPEHRGGRDPGP